MQITKSKFETMLYKLNNEEALGYRKHTEMNYDDCGNQTAIICHLYYNDNGHIGTWVKGEGTIFGDRI